MLQTKSAPVVENTDCTDEHKIKGPVLLSGCVAIGF